MKRTRLTMFVLALILPVLWMVGLATAVVNLHTPTTPYRRIPLAPPPNYLIHPPDLKGFKNL